VGLALTSRWIGRIDMGASVGSTSVLWGELYDEGTSVHTVPESPIT